MKRQKRREPLGRVNYLKAFPYHLFPEMRESQREFLESIAMNDGRATGEAATGTGKSAVGISFLTALKLAGQSPLFYIVPTKTFV